MVANVSDWLLALSGLRLALARFGSWWKLGRMQFARYARVAYLSPPPPRCTQSKQSMEKWNRSRIMLSCPSNLPSTVLACPRLRLGFHWMPMMCWVTQGTAWCGSKKLRTGIWARRKRTHNDQQIKRESIICRGRLSVQQ